jgi:hypothetical protein
VSGPDMQNEVQKVPGKHSLSLRGNADLAADKCNTMVIKCRGLHLHNSYTPGGPSIQETGQGHCRGHREQDGFSCPDQEVFTPGRGR